MNAQSEAASWYETTQVENPRRPRLNYELDVDVCVIGAGLAGLTVAREVARRGWSVAVLEAGRVGGAASGHNTGFVLPGFAEDVGPMIERIGLDHTKELWTLSQAGVDYVRRTIAETGMPGVNPVAGWLNVSKIDNWREIRNRVEQLRWLGAEVEAWPAERVREVLPSDRYFGAMHCPGAFHIHVLNYVIGLSRAVETAGARLFEDTPALEIDPAGVRKRVQTPGGRVRAGHVVLAANVQLGSLMPRLGATLMPVTTYVMETGPLGPLLQDIVRYRGAVTDTSRFDNHYRVIGGDRLQWSGFMTVGQVDARRFARRLSTSIHRIFTQLGAVKAAHVWSGTFGRTIHHMPQIGEIERGIWVASGFDRHGLNTTALAGELVARGIVESDQTWRLFAPYELVWAGGKIFRAVAKTIYAASRPVAGIREGFARQRERSRKRREIRMAAKIASRTATKAAVAPVQPDSTKSAEPPSPPPAAKAPPVERKPDATAAMLPTPELVPGRDDGRQSNGKSARRKRTTP